MWYFIYITYILQCVIYMNVLDIANKNEIDMPLRVRVFNTISHLRKINGKLMFNS